jgi:hypothetical protein
LTLPRGYVAPDKQNVLSQPSNYRLIVDSKLIKRELYELDKIKSTVKESFSDVYWLVINPIEAGSGIEFCGQSAMKVVPVYRIPVQDITNVTLIETDRGRMRSKGLAVKISFYKNSKMNEIVIECPGSKERELVQNLENLRQMDRSAYWQKYNIAYRTNDEQIKFSEIYPMTPFLAPDEQLVWYRLKTSGVLNTKAKWIQAVTSYRVLEYNFDTHGCSALPLSSLDSAVVANRKIESQTSQSDIFIGTGYSAGVIQGSANTTSATVGDVIFTQSGKNLMIFTQILDPDGVASVFHSARSVILTEQEYNEHVNPRIPLASNKKMKD